MSTYLLITPKEDELYHYGVKGMKWRVKKGSSQQSGMVSSGGGDIKVEDVEEAEKNAQQELQQQEYVNKLISRMKFRTPKETRFHRAASEKYLRNARSKAKSATKRAESARKIVQQMSQEFNHADYGEEILMSVIDFTPGDLEHHGIKGQKWGVRRFQPYRQGMKVAGGKVVGAAKKVKQRFKDIGDTRQKRKAEKAKAKSVKKALATRKANADFEAEKKKAIESGSIEDLAKFKGKLTNEEYGRAFLRLQNEKKMSDMVAANQKTVWDTIDKGMNIVQKVGGYANTIATAKENFTKLDKAFNGERDKAAEDAKKSIKDAEKNRALTQVTNITELDKVQKKYNLNADDYAKGLRLISTKEYGKKVNEQAFTNEDKAKNTPVDGTYRSKDNVKKNASYDNSDPKDFKAPPRTLSEKAGYKNPDGETGYTGKTIESGKRVISGFKSGTDKPVSYNSQQTLSFGESTVKRLSTSAPKASQVKKDMEPSAAEKKRKRALGK